MKRAIYTSLAVLALWCSVGVNFASAQFGTLGQQRNTPGGGGFNPYGILRPPFDTSRPGDPLLTLQRMNADGSLQGLLAAQTNLNAQVGLQTGHSVTWLDYQHYFPNSVPTGSAGGSIGSTGGLTGTGQGFGSFNQNPAGFTGFGNMSGFQRR